ncbi:MAG: molybdenum cofactor guanylyltransferase [Arthrobacter sp.]
MEFDAVILAGGRSSRLGGVPKARLVYEGSTLLERALFAARGARAVAVVGPDPGTLPPGVLSCREDPPFAGPAAAIAAGLEALDRRLGAERSDLTLILACDMPRVDYAVSALRSALPGSTRDAGAGATSTADPASTTDPAGAGASTGAPSGSDGVMAVSVDGRKQPLAGLYSTHVLKESVAELEQRGGLIGGSVFALLARLDVRVVTVPAGSTDDVDTWDDAAAFGVSGQGS